EAGFLEPVTDPRFLRLAGGTVAWSTPFGVALLSPEDDETPGTLYRSGPFRLDVDSAHYVFLRGPRFGHRLGQGIGECGDSSEGCFGVDMVQQSGDFIAIHDADFGRDTSTETVTVYDRQGRATTPCGHEVLRFVLAPDGAVACSQLGAIYSAGQLIDS